MSASTTSSTSSSTPPARDRRRGSCSGDGIPTIDRRRRAEPALLARPEPGRDPLRAGDRRRRSAALDPAGAATYAANAAAYTTELDALDDANKAAVATIPAANRKLVTFHDAFPYFAAHYGFEVIGVILPNVGQEPSASDLAALVEKVKAADVKAVFAEAQFNPELARTLADGSRGHGRS